MQDDDISSCHGLRYHLDHEGNEFIEEDTVISLEKEPSIVELIDKLKMTVHKSEEDQQFNPFVNDAQNFCQGNISILNQDFCFTLKVCFEKESSISEISIFPFEDISFPDQAIPEQTLMLDIQAPNFEGQLLGKLQKNFAQIIVIEIQNPNQILFQTPLMITFSGKLNPL